MKDETTESSSESRYLIIMRHAKSDWSDGSLSDHDRPLNERGCRDAPRMALWLADQSMVPDRILSSSSTRTRQTATLLCSAWPDPPEVQFEESLYLASPDTMLQSIRGVGVDSHCLMVLAHNPGVSYLASVLSGESVEMPTAAAAVLRYDVDSWAELTDATVSELVHFMRPKAL